MTKLEIEKENKELKAKIRELQKTAKVASEVSGELADTAYGISVIEEEDGKKWLAVVRISFDLAKNCAIIDKESLVIKARGPLAGLAKESIVTEIIKRSKEI